ncbi:MAG: hypothetical protein WCK67_00890 [bacterium]
MLNIKNYNFSVMTKNNKTNNKMNATVNNIDENQGLKSSYKDKTLFPSNNSSAFFLINSKNINTSFTASGIQEPEAFEKVHSDFLYKGSCLENSNEFRYIVNKGVNTIISFVAPENEEYISSEVDLINNYNKKNPLNQITFKCLPLWSTEGWDRLENPEERKKIKEEFCKLLNENPPPFYMHCLAGRHISAKMKEIFNEAVAEGKILLPDDEL